MQEHLTDCIGAVGVEFASALAARFDSTGVDSCPFGPCMCCHCCLDSATLVSILLPFLHLERVLVQPVGRARISGAYLHFTDTACRSHHALVGKGSVAP